MATTNGRDPFASLDDILLPGEGRANRSRYSSARTSQGYDFLNTDLAGTIAEAKRISANTSDKAYRKLTAAANVTTYSLLTQLHKCPRLFELEKLQANSEVPMDSGIPNLDFAFGHAVGAGIQTYAATRNLVAAQFAAFLAWKAPFDAEKLDRYGKSTGKSLAHATFAVEKFQYFFEQELSEYEVVRLPSGKPATELAFAVDMQNGFYHFGHVDTVLQSKHSGKLAVWEGKTTGSANIDEAEYANSNQALGYSVVVDAIAKQLGLVGSEYEVLYIVYSSKEQEFKLLSFTKSRTQRAEWIQDVLLDQANLGTYQRISFYPKRGENCINKYGFKCSRFGDCTMHTDSLFPGVVPAKLTDIHSVESLDFTFTLEQLIAAQKEK